MPIQKTNRDSTWIINSSNRTWTLAKNATITAENQDGIDENGCHGSEIRVLGDITVSGAQCLGASKSAEAAADDNDAGKGRWASKLFVFDIGELGGGALSLIHDVTSWSGCRRRDRASDPDLRLYRV